MGATKLVPAIEAEHGANASVGMEGNVSPILNLPESAQAVRKSYDKLTSRLAKREFFNSGFTRIDRDMPGAWARLYWFLNLCRNETWFWREQGYSSFDAFWADQGEFAFGEIGKLEAMFNFAKLACPRMFELREQDARQLWKLLGNLTSSTASDANGKAHNQPRRGQQNGRPLRFADLDYDLQSDEFKRGFRQADGAATAVRRFRRLKRLAPAVAQQVLDGKFVRHVGGEPTPDLAAAEKSAGIFRRRSKSRTEAQIATPSVAAAHIGSLNANELDDMWEALDGNAKRRLRSLLRRV